MRDALLNDGIAIDHACGKVGACTICHVAVTKGLDSLNQVQEHEEDMLDMARGLKPDSRLSCQAIAGEADITVGFPKYSVNHTKENG